MQDFSFIFLIGSVLLIHLVCSTPCDRIESIDISDGFLNEDNSSIEFENAVYSRDEWFEVTEDGVEKKFGCPCIKRICLWRCCGTGQAYHDRSCNDSDISEVNPFNPQVFKGNDPVSVNAYERFFYMYNRLCNKRYPLDSAEAGNELYLQENGTLFEISNGQSQWHVPTSYCIDIRLDDINPPRPFALICFPEQQSTDDTEELYIAYGVGLVLSVPFLLITFLVYGLITELRNLHGMCLMAYCAGLIVAYPFLAYLKFSNGDVAAPMTGCIFIAFIVYYAFQTSFFWLNVMCFDIWRTFSGYRGGGTHKRKELKRFAMYGAYAWGVPLILTICTAAMHYNDSLPEHILRPNFGLKKCWFSEWKSELAYFYTPVVVLVICNLVLFGVTANRIRSIRQETAILKGAESARSDKLKRDKQRYCLYLKLFIVMGVNWTVEVISFAIGGSNWYWILTDLSNISLGFFIFIIFVWKNKVRNLLLKRVRTVRGIPTTTDSTMGRWATRSSSAPTEDTRISTDDTGIRLKDIH